MSFFRIKTLIFAKAVTNFYNPIEKFPLFLTELKRKQFLTLKKILLVVQLKQVGLRFLLFLQQESSHNLAEPFLVWRFVAGRFVAGSFFF